MPENDNPTTPSGETPPTTLREAAEAAWETVVEEPALEQEAEPPVDTGDRRRDEYGRFAKVEPGEAEAAPPPPSPDEIDAPDDRRSTQPRQGVAAEPPENWSAADKDMFAKAPAEMQAWAMRRHSEMEGDYQRKVQAYAQAAQFTQGLAPVFTDPVISGSLQQMGVTPQDAINEWAGFHKRAVSPNLVDRANLVLDLAARIGVPLNPAAIGQPSQQGLPPELAKDPAIKFFAEHLGQNAGEIQALKSQIQSFVQKSQKQEAEEAFRVTKWGIDSFADAKDQQGNLLHPDFDEVTQQIAQLYQINPQRDLNEAYETACNMNPKVYARRLQRDVEAQLKRQSDQRAAQAARLNTRGRTTRVAGPSGANGDGRPMSLRDTLEATADELGL